MQYIQWIQQDKLRLINQSLDSTEISQSDVDNERRMVSDFFTDNPITFLGLIRKLEAATILDLVYRSFKPQGSAILSFYLFTLLLSYSYM